MQGLAQSLAQGGMTVTGSGLTSPTAGDVLRRLGVTIHPVPVARWFPPETCLLVHGADVVREHPARLGALRRGIAQTTPARWLKGRMLGRVGVAVAGGREASVAAAMTGWVLTRAGKDPSVMLGRHSPQLGGWARTGRGPHVIAEWPEGPEALGSVDPRITLLMRVGADPWVNPTAWSSKFRHFLDFVPRDGHVLALGHPELLEFASARPAIVDDPKRFSWLSFRPGSGWSGADLRGDAGGCRFRAFNEGRFVCEVGLRVPGRRNALSALAAVAACDRLGLSVLDIREGLEEFAGLSRDFELRGSFRGVTLVDDASEDAGSIRNVLSLARRTFGLRRLWAVFAAPARVEPAELARLVAVFADADRVVILEGGGADEPDEGGTCRALTRGLAALRVPARCEADLSAAVAELDRSLEPGDVLLTLGTGDVGTIADAFIRRLPRDRQGG